MPNSETNHAVGKRFGPLLILIGLLLGTSAATTFSLSGVALIAYVLGPDYPQLAAELPVMLENLGLFAPLTVVAGLSFYAELTGKPWRWPVFAALAAAVAGVVAHFWPS
jgi:uncharacterized membrane protein HdeD (DUF308 family)